MSATNDAPNAEEPLYVVEETDRFDADRDAAFLYLFQRFGPEYANAWLKGLLQAVSGLWDFPGPLSYAVDYEASITLGAEIRRMLYAGKHRKRRGPAYRVLFRLLPPDEEGIIIIQPLRLLHGAQMLTPPEDKDV